MTMFDTLWDTPMGHRGWMLVRESGVVNFRGIDHGATVIVAAQRVAALDGTVLTLREKGGKHWAGRGMKAKGHPASLRTVLVQLDANAKQYDRVAQYRYVELVGSTAILANDDARQAQSAKVAAWIKEEK